MAQSFGPGLLIGVSIAVCGEMMLVLVTALWLRRPRAVAVAALLGAATSDTVLGSISAWVGGSIARAVPDADLRATIAVGLLLGVAGWLVVRMLIGGYGVPGNAELPARPIATWARFAAIGLFGPIPPLILGANALAWPDLTAGDAGLGLVAGAASGALLFRWQWAVAARRNRGNRSTRTMHAGLGIAGLLLIGLWVVWIVGR